MQSDHESDERLMQLAAGGRRDRLEVLVRRYASPVLTFIRRMVGDPGRSEELFQEVFLAVWAHRRKYEYPRPFRAWLYAIAWNKCREDFRRASADPVELDDVSPLCPVSAGPSPAEAAIAAETAAMVAAAVATLPVVQRTVVVLRVWNGLGYPEIARIMDLAETTVRTYMCRAVAALRKHMEPRMRT